MPLERLRKPGSILRRIKPLTSDLSTWLGLGFDSANGFDLANRFTPRYVWTRKLLNPVYGLKSIQVRVDGAYFNLLMYP